MEIGKAYFKPYLDTENILVKALADIKEAIKQDPHREIVGDQTLTLVKIYAIVEEAEKKVNLQHK